MVALDRRVGPGPLVLCWALAAAAYIAKAVLTAGTTPLLLDSDDAMRLTEVHDLVGGQHWFDLVQHRLNTPFGVEMHWSRLIDVPEAALLMLLRPLGGGMADMLTATIWPLLLLAPLLWLSTTLALRLGRGEARWPALLMPIVSLTTLSEFVPGRLDHHSAQTLLSLAMLACCIGALDRPRYALGAGIAAALALAIGIEGLPLVAATIAVFALLWAVSGEHRVALRDFGLSFGLATALLFAVGVPAAEWLVQRVDAISIVYATAAGLTGLAFLVLSLLPFKGIAARLIAMLVAGALVVAALTALDPEILRGPYAALDPWLVKNWLSHIAEAQSWAQSYADDPLYPLGVTVPTLLGLGAAIWNAVRRKPNRGAWLIVAAFLVIGLLVMLVQIRAARLVTPLAVPACAALVATAWRRLVARPGLIPALGVVGSVVASSGLAVAIVVALLPFPAPTDKTVSGDRRACLMPAAFTDLAALPPERLMAPVDLGAHLLALTPHAVVGAPYHRDQQGLLDTLHFFNLPLAEARGILVARGIGLVVVCPALSEMRGTGTVAPDSFIALYGSHQLPDWLVDESLPDSPLKIYAVLPPGG